jgi:hypothetical protein
MRFAPACSKNHKNDRWLEVKFTAVAQIYDNFLLFEFIQLKFLEENETYKPCVKILHHLDLDLARNGHLLLCEARVCVHSLKYPGPDRILSKTDICVELERFIKCYIIAKSNLLVLIIILLSCNQLNSTYQFFS